MVKHYANSPSRCQLRATVENVGLIKLISNCILKCGRGGMVHHRALTESELMKLLFNPLEMYYGDVSPLDTAWNYQAHIKFGRSVASLMLGQKRWCYSSRRCCVLFDWCIRAVCSNLSIFLKWGMGATFGASWIIAARTFSWNDCDFRELSWIWTRLQDFKGMMIDIDEVMMENVAAASGS